MTCTSVFELMPQKGEFIFKVFLVFYYYYYYFVIKEKKEARNTYLVHCLFVSLRWLSVHVVE